MSKIEPKLRFLCICAGGNVRSRAMAYILMDRCGQDALSAGAVYQPETIASLAAMWADRIVIMTPEYISVVPENQRHKVRCCDVGPDTYGTCWNFLLIGACETFAREWASRKFVL